MIPGWPYSFVVALEANRTPGRNGRLSHDATRIDLALEPEHRRGHGVLNKGRLDIGKPTYLPCLPVHHLGWLRSDHVMCHPAPTRVKFAAASRAGGPG